MPDWEDLRHLATLAAEGSLSAAARRLGVDHATVARRVAALEQDLDQKLIDRRGRRIVLTPAGARIAALAGDMDKVARAIERAAAGARERIAGTVTLSCPPALAAARLVAPLAELVRTHPDLRLRLVGETRSASLDRREADLAVRLSLPEAGDLVASRIGTMPFRFYGSRAYLAETAPADWRFVGYDAPLEGSEQQKTVEAVAAGRPIVLTGSTSEIQCAAVRAGAGIGLLPDFLAATDAELTPIETGKPLFERGIYLVIHEDMRTAAPVRAVAEALRRAQADAEAERRRVP